MPFLTGFLKSRTLPTMAVYSVNSSPASINSSPTPSSPSGTYIWWLVVSGSRVKYLSDLTISCTKSNIYIIGERLLSQVSLERADSAASSLSFSSTMVGNRPSLTTLSRRLNSQGSSVYSDSISRTGSLLHVEIYKLYSQCIFMRIVLC